MNNLEKVRSVIVRANPRGMAVGSFCSAHAGLKKENGCPACKRTCHRSPRLADVLIAIENAGKEGGLQLEVLNGSLAMRYENKNGYCLWWLRDDKLDDQSPECIDFLTSVLCNE